METTADASSEQPGLVSWPARSTILVPTGVALGAAVGIVAWPELTSLGIGARVGTAVGLTAIWPLVILAYVSLRRLRQYAVLWRSTVTLIERNAVQDVAVQNFRQENSELRMKLDDLQASMRELMRLVRPLMMQLTYPIVNVAASPKGVHLIIDASETELQAGDQVLILDKEALAHVGRFEVVEATGDRCSVSPLAIYDNLWWGYVNQIAETRAALPESNVVAVRLKEQRKGRDA